MYMYMYMVKAELVSLHAGGLTLTPHTRSLLSE